MKKVLNTILIALTTILFFSCASMPEPSEKVKTLVYGQVSFDFKGIASNYGIPESNVEKNGITIKVKNVKSKKSYVASSNNNGEFTFSNLPKGTYSVNKLSKTISFASGFKSNIEVEEIKQIKDRYYFKVQNDGVVNLGQIDIDIQVTNAELEYYYYRIYTHWKKDYDSVRNFFNNKHYESNWNFEEWLTAAETMQIRDNN